jgi:hypothetical protein
MLRAWVAVVGKLRLSSLPLGRWRCADQTGKFARRA